MENKKMDGWSQAELGEKLGVSEQIVEKNIVQIDFEYKGYITEMNYHPEDNVYYGKLENIRDLSVSLFFADFHFL